MSIASFYDSQHESVLSSHNPGMEKLTFASFYSPENQITFNELDKLVNNKIAVGILVGTKMGAAALMLLVLWIVSKNKKTPIFIINQVTLLLVLCHSILYIKNLLGTYSSLTYNLTLAINYVTKKDLNIYFATNIIQVLLIAAIEVSLIFQVRVIFKSDNYKLLGTFFTFISTVLGIATVTVYAMAAIDCIRSAIENSEYARALYFNLSTIFLALSMNFMTLLLSVKLFLAIRSRRFLGLKQFDSLHILLIISTQTLIFPSILFILAYLLKSHGTDSLTTIGILLIVLSLPLSSMWATSANNSLHPNSINTKFTPHHEIILQNPTNPSYYAQSTNSKRDWELNKIYDLYPMTKFISESPASKNAASNTMVDFEISSFKVKPYCTTKEHQLHLQTPSTTPQHAEMEDKDNIQTPSTKADEDARIFWSEFKLPNPNYNTATAYIELNKKL